MLREAAKECAEYYGEGHPGGMCRGQHVAGFDRGLTVCDQADQ